uniref:ribonucleoside-diphosphate reductase n=1 Tax=viral metagenome TaxID=1070528 RepID=A0A6C0E2L3_9ZZZZ
MSIDATVIDMMVMKRNGKLEEIAFDKILKRIKKICVEANIQINHSSLAMKVIDQLYNNIPTSKIDELIGEQCATMASQNPDYGTLASRIIISNHQKNTCASFYIVMNKLYEFEDSNSLQQPLISQQLWDFTQCHANEIEEMIDHNRDYFIDYFGFKTLERAYLFKLHGKIVERVQHMWMRVAIGIHGDLQDQHSLHLVKQTYDLMSCKYFTHATPTLFNAGTPRPQLSSCYLIGMQEDSIEGIYDTLKDCAIISKYSGGIGLHIHNIRSKGSFIKGTNGTSNGIVPMLRVFNNTARYVDQSGKRNGSFAIYLEPWHADIQDFLILKNNHGDEELKARDLFYALWVPDLFMKRVKENGKWTLFCPHVCPGLADVYGDEFVQLYLRYEEAGKGTKTINARDLWYQILDSQMETGTPYLLYKDAANKKSNQQNLGTIKSSNLCTEIIEYSDENETAVCNLASIGLPTFVNPQTKTFDYDKLHEVTKIVTQNLNKIIDINFYPTEKTRISNMSHRPIGIGVQGLADTFFLLDVPFHSDEAKQINKDIFETIYHASLEKSNEIAYDRHVIAKDNLILKNRNTGSYFTGTGVNIDGHNFTYKELQLPVSLAGSYSSFVGSPASQGILQFDMWNVIPSDRYDWSSLKTNIVNYGLRNSLLVAPMPTASTSQILGYNECFEPITSNIYSRRTLAGEFVVPNKYLIKELIQLGMWNEQIKQNIIANKGSVQQLTMLPEHVRNKYKIVWEIPMKHLIDMSADRGAFICQSQSLNLWLEDPNYNMLTSMHFYSWTKGLKTGIYYLRRKAKHQAQQFTIEPEKKTSKDEIEEEICEMCSA